MHLFVPYEGSHLARIALMEACRMATPIDRVTVMVAVLVPRQYAVDVPAGYIWNETNRADRLLKEARRYADRMAHYGAELRGVQVQARTNADAILAGAAHYGADTIVFAASSGPRGRLASLFGTLPTVIRHAPCDVRVIYVTRPRYRDAAEEARPVEHQVPTAGSAPDRSTVPDGVPERATHDDSMNVEGVGKADV